MELILFPSSIFILLINLIFIVKNKKENDDKFYYILKIATIIIFISILPIALLYEINEYKKEEIKMIYEIEELQDSISNIYRDIQIKNIKENGR